MVDTVRLSLLRQMAQARSIREARVVGRRGGWTVIVAHGHAEHALASKTGQTRLFKTVDSAARVLRDVGVARFAVDSSKFSPATTARKRPDTAQAMRTMHAHSRWFHDQVEQGLADIDAGRIVSDDVHKTRWTQRRATLERRVRGKAK